MSSKKNVTDGRRTISFLEADIAELAEWSIAERKAETDLIRDLVRDYLGGRLVRKEVVDTYKDIVGQLTDARRSTGAIPTFKAGEEDEQNRKTG